LSSVSAYKVLATPIYGPQEVSCRENFKNSYFSGRVSRTIRYMRNSSSVISGLAKASGPHGEGE
jgi:hypothetical protein